jgi:CPA2 family monovalent cation:H+ antiporter-2
MDQPAAAMHTLLSARAAHPGLPVYVRSMDEAHAHELRAAGATGVIPETLEAALQLAALALASTGMDDHAVTQAIAAERNARI